MVEPTYLADFEVDKVQADFYFSGAIYDVDDKPYSHKEYSKQLCSNTVQIRDCFFEQRLKDNGYPFGKLFRRDIIEKNHLRFNERLSINEDHLFVFQYFLCIETLFVTAVAGYHYLVFDNSGRKLSDKINTYSELRLASDAFNIEIAKMRAAWLLNDVQVKELINGFVLSKRLHALRSMALLGSWAQFDEEVKYWQSTEYMPSNMKEKFVLCIVRCFLPQVVKRLLLRMFYLSLKILSKDRTKAIYQDLARRSERYK